MLSLVENPHSWAGPDLPLLPTKDAARKLAEYLESLLAWNSKLNLVGRADPQRILSDLIQDSFYLASFLESVFPDYGMRKTMRIFDLGAGAGIPGIPLRILWPLGEYVWIERSSKRALFLQNVSARLRLGLQGVCDSAANFFRAGNCAECIISRAFMPWRELLELCATGLARSGAVIIMANSRPPEMPPGWTLSRTFAYTTARERWLWAVRRNSDACL